MENELILTEREPTGIMIAAEMLMTARRDEKINFDLELPIVVVEWELTELEAALLGSMTGN